ncbi:MAG: NADH-quinone oxidoreductase subunit NuoE [Asgard group archaeon]|nr:NADH-quinone oxidoreductase subunit NuoE [Asgard group archaeon]
MSIKRIHKIRQQEFELSDRVIKKMDAILGKVDKSPEKLIQVLQDLQQAFNYLPEKVLSYIAKEMDLSEHTVYGVATFYSQFKFIKPGKHTIRVCMGTACHVKGAQSLVDKVSRELGIEPGETTEDDQFSLETVFCLGCCALAPVMVIDEDVYGNMTAAKVPKILRDYRKKSKKTSNKKKKKGAK